MTQISGSFTINKLILSIPIFPEMTLRLALEQHFPELIILRRCAICADTSVPAHWFADCDRVACLV